MYNKEMREMNKLLIGGLAAIALTLTGCTTTAEPAPTVTQTVTAAPKATQESNSSSSLSKDDMFELMMISVGTPSYFLEGELLYLLQDVAKDTCGYIADGMSSSDIIFALSLILDGTADPEVEDAFMAATVASVYSYCPQYDGFWD